LNTIPVGAGFKTMEEENLDKPPIVEIVEITGMANFALKS
jgi:hypothetical protein